MCFYFHVKRNRKFTKFGLTCVDPILRYLDCNAAIARNETEKRFQICTLFGVKFIMIIFCWMEI